MKEIKKWITAFIFIGLIMGVIVQYVPSTKGLNTLTLWANDTMGNLNWTTVTFTLCVVDDICFYDIQKDGYVIYGIYDPAEVPVYIYPAHRKEDK